MGFIDTGIAKSRAAASDARADLAEGKSAMIAAQTQLKAASTTEDALKKVSGTWFGQLPLVSSLVLTGTAHAEAQRARAQASVDDLHAKTEAARTRLAMAEKSQNAMTKVAETGDKIAEKADEVFNG